ncbi:MAG: hypothetical protein WC479_11790 [Candidatus Izemoplasmatales bacterium]
MDATKPTDQENVSAQAEYIREARAAINALSAGTGFGVTELEIPAGSVALTIGTDLGNYGFEIAVLTADGAVSIATLNGGTQGQTKVIIAQDNNISIVDGLAVSGHIYLNQLPALSSFAMQSGDVLGLVNIGGDGALVEGYWQEVWRKVALK